MLHRNLVGAIALTGALLLPLLGAQAHDNSKYPNWEGKWNRDPGPPRYDPSKPGRRGQQPPLTPEYEKIFEASLADQALGGQGNNVIHKCLPVGMPRQLASGFPIDIIISGKATTSCLNSRLPRHAKSIPTAAIGPRRSFRLSPAIRSANGSTPTATANSNARDRNPPHEGPARSSTMPEFRCTRTTRPW